MFATMRRAVSFHRVQSVFKTPSGRDFQGGGAESSDDEESLQDGCPADLEADLENGSEAKVEPKEDPHPYAHLIFMTLEQRHYSWSARVIGALMMAAILTNCASFVLGSMQKYRYQPPSCLTPVCADAACRRRVCPPEALPVLHRIEGGTIIVFTIEYLLRLATVGFIPIKLIYPDTYMFKKAPRVEPSFVSKVLGYAVQPMNLIDLVSVLPWWLHLLFLHHSSLTLDYLRLLRLGRIFQIIRIARYTESAKLVTSAMRRSAPALFLLLVLLLTLTMVFGTLAYHYEQGEFRITPEHPEGAYFRRNSHGTGWEVSPYKDILTSSYWVIMTATTVGYGDYTPTSSGGRVVAVLCAVCGIIAIALPMTIITRSFNDVYYDARDLQKAEDKILKKDHDKIVHQILHHNHHHPAHHRPEGGGDGHHSSSPHPHQPPHDPDGHDSSSASSAVASRVNSIRRWASNRAHSLRSGGSAGHHPHHRHHHHPHQDHGPPHPPSMHHQVRDYDDDPLAEELTLRRRALASLIKDQLNRMENSNRYVLIKLAELEAISD